MQILVPHLLEHCDEAVFAAEGLLAAAKESVRARVETDGAISVALLDREQRAAHALAWFATTVEVLRQMARWARELAQENRLHEFERLILAAAFGEYLANSRAASR